MAMFFLGKVRKILEGQKMGGGKVFMAPQLTDTIPLAESPNVPLAPDLGAGAVYTQASGLSQSLRPTYETQVGPGVQRVVLNSENAEGRALVSTGRYFFYLTVSQAD